MRWNYTKVKSINLSITLPYLQIQTCQKCRSLPCWLPWFHYWLLCQFLEYHPLLHHRRVELEEGNLPPSSSAANEIWVGSSDPSLSFTMKLRTCDNNLKAFEIVKYSTDWWIRYNQTEGQSDVKFVYQQSFYQIVNHVPSLIHIPLWNQFSFSIGGGGCQDDARWAIIASVSKRSKVNLLFFHTHSHVLIIQWMNHKWLGGNHADVACAWSWWSMTPCDVAC